jgi:photosystem II stability/assembly factor-like uncharacterized protein
MKKLLLSILLVVSISANAQQFWTEKATGFDTAARGLYSISIVDANVVWAEAYNYDGLYEDTTIKEFTKSTDGGNNWTSGTIYLGADTNELGISSITATSETTAWVSATTGDTQLGGIWKTVDGGVTWTKQTTAQFSDLYHSYANFVHFWDANNGIAVGDPENDEFEIYTTNDGGTTWTRVPAANIPDLIIIDVNPDPLVTVLESEYCYENLYEVSGSTIWFGTDRGRIFKSTDKGLTWTANQSPSIDFRDDKITFSDANKGLLAKYTLDQPTTLYSTNDGGENWIQVISSGTISKDHIAYIPGTSIVVSTQEKDTSNGGKAGSSYSTDDGMTWTTIDADVFHGELAFLNSSFGFSAGLTTEAIPPTTPPTTTGGISKFTGIPLKASSFDVKNQITAYPNPTNGILNINSENSLIKEASVFDLLGREVYKPKFSVLNNVTFDLHSLQTGAYILKVTSDSGKTETVKIMKN